MAESNGTKAFLSGIAGNAAWEWIKAVCGGLMTSLVSGVTQYLRHQHTDWWGLVILGTITTVLLAVVFIKYPRSVDRNESSGIIVDVPIGVNHQCCIQFPDEGQKNDYISIRDRGYECCLLFTVLQMECFKTAKDLQNFADEHKKNPRTADDVSIWQSWHGIMTATYEADLAPRVKSLYLQCKKQGIWAEELMPYIEREIDINKIATIPAKLWIVSRRLSGIEDSQ